MKTFQTFLTEAINPLKKVLGSFIANRFNKKPLSGFFVLSMFENSNRWCIRCSIRKLFYDTM